MAVAEQAAAAAATAANAGQSASQPTIPPPNSGTGSTSGLYLSQNQLLNASLLGSVVPELFPAKEQQSVGQPPPSVVTGLLPGVGLNQQASAPVPLSLSLSDQQTLAMATNLYNQTANVGTSADGHTVLETDAAVNVEVVPRSDCVSQATWLSLLAEALLRLDAQPPTPGSHNPSLAGASAALGTPQQQQALLQVWAAQQAALQSGQLPPTSGTSLSAQQQQQQQQLAQLGSALSSKPSDRKPRKKPKSKPRYILRVTKIERDSDSSEPSSLRPTFYLEMPDLTNPNSELWKLSFRCNLSDTLEDIKLFKGSGYTPANEDIDRAAKEAVVQMLESLRNDVNSIKLNQDYVFYPRPTAQLPGSNFLTPVPADVPTPGVPYAANILTPGKCSQTSSSVPSLASRSLPYQPGIAATSLIPTSQTGSAGVSSPNLAFPASPLLYDPAAAVANLEEVPPIDHPGHHNSLVGTASSETQFAPGIQPVPVNGHIGVLANSTDTVHEDDEELSENSRPLSPSETSFLQHQQHYASVQHQLFVNNLDPVTVSKPSSTSSSTPYFTASSQFGGLPPAIQPNVLFPVGTTSTIDSADAPGPRPSALQLGANYVSELLSLAAKRVDHIGSVVNGFQPGCLEDIAPVIADATNTQCVPSMESVSQRELNTNESVIRGDNQPFDNTSLLFPQLSQTSSANHCRLGANVLSCPNPVDSEVMINLTCTIPASLEGVMREITSRLCNAPTKAYVLLPTSTGVVDSAGSTQSHSNIRVLEIPQNHIFLGIPSVQEQLGPFSLTTFRAPTESAFIILDDPGSESRLPVPRVYRTPNDTAVVLSPNGAVHCLDKAALVVPSHSNEPRRSPPLSPGADSNETSRATHQPSSSVQVRELPIHANVDTLTLDDVLNLLLALRSTSQQYQRSNATSPTTDTYSAPNASTIIEGQAISCTASRRSSTAGVVHNAHHPSSLSLSHALPASHLAQVQQLSLNRQQRSMPAAYPQQLVKTFTHPEQHQTQTYSNIAGSRISTSYPSGTPDVPTIPGSAFTSHVPVYPQLPTTLAVPMTQSIVGSTSSSKFLTHDRMPASTPQISNTVTPSNLQHWSHLLPSSITPTDPGAATVTALQQAIQLLSTSNVPIPPEQLPLLVSQLLRNAGMVQPVQASFLPTVSTGLRTPGQGSSSANTIPMNTRPVVPGQSAAQRASNVSPPVQQVGPPLASSTSLNLLTAFMNRILASTAQTATDWNEAQKLAFPAATSFVKSVLPTPSQPPPAAGGPVDCAYMLNPGGPALPSSHSQVTNQQIPSSATGQQRKAQPPDQQQASLGQQNLQSSFPELVNVLRILQKQSESNITKEPPTNLTPDAQARLLAALQLHTSFSSPILNAASQQPVHTAMQAQSTPVFSSQSTLLKPQAPSKQPTSAGYLPSSSAMQPCVVSGATTGIPPIGLPQAIDPSRLQTVDVTPRPTAEPLVNRPMPPVSTTVANKFTVVPVKSESEEPASPTVVASVPQQPNNSVGSWNQAPPRPPRQRPHVNQNTSVPPPPPPATPNCHLSADSTSRVVVSNPLMSGAALTPILTTVNSAPTGPAVSSKPGVPAYSAKADEARPVAQQGTANIPISVPRTVKPGQPPISNIPVGSVLSTGGTTPIVPVSVSHLISSSVASAVTTSNPSATSNGSSTTFGS